MKRDSTASGKRWALLAVTLVAAVALALLAVLGLRYRAPLGPPLRTVSSLGLPPDEENGLLLLIDGSSAHRGPLGERLQARVTARCAETPPTFDDDDLPAADLFFLYQDAWTSADEKLRRIRPHAEALARWAAFGCPWLERVDLAFTAPHFGGRVSPHRDDVRGALSQAVLADNHRMLALALHGEPAAALRHAATGVRALLGMATGAHRLQTVHNAAQHVNDYLAVVDIVMEAAQGTEGTEWYQALDDWRLVLRQRPGPRLEAVLVGMYEYYYDELERDRRGIAADPYGAFSMDPPRTREALDAWWLGLEAHLLRGGPEPPRASVSSFLNEEGALWMRHRVARSSLLRYDDHLADAVHGMGANLDAALRRVERRQVEAH